MEYPLSQLRKYHELSESFIRDLSKMIRRLEPAKNATLLLKGDICTDMYLIETGMLVCYDFHEDKKYCSWIMTEGDFVTSVKSFNNQVISTEMIITLTKCLLWAITKQNVDELTGKYLEFKAIRQILTDYYNEQGREMDTKRKRPSEQFYEYLLEFYPAITKKSPKTTLAAYMGITRTKLYEIIKNRSK